MRPHEVPGKRANSPRNRLQTIQAFQKLLSSISSQSHGRPAGISLGVRSVNPGASEGTVELTLAFARQ